MSNAEFRDNNKFMKEKALQLLLAIIFLLISTNTVIEGEHKGYKEKINKGNLINEKGNDKVYTSEYFGVKFKPWKIIYLNNEDRLSDTIAIGRFDCLDAYRDFAVYHRSRGTIAIYSNQRNRFYQKTSEIKIEKQVKKIESYLADEGVPIGLKRHGLRVKFMDGTEERLEGERLAGIKETSTLKKIKVPEHNFLQDSRVFVYDYEFIEKKRFATGFINDYTTVGDIDKDGLNELIYTFRTSSQINTPTHLVVFECLPGNQYRIDWDTVLPKGWGNVYKDITDLDRDGRNECFVIGNRFNQYYGAMLQCISPGVYRMFDNALPISSIDVVICDTLKNDSLHRAGLWTNSDGEPYSYVQCYNIVKISNAYYFWPHTGLRFYGSACLDLEVGDIDGDGKQEIVWGDDNSSGALYYIDSTGIATNSGYEARYYEFPNQELGTGWSKLKDFDNDGKPEIVACSDAYGSGAIGVIKHTGEPGENKYQIMWRTTEGLFNAPNFGIDSGSIDGKYTILYSLYKFINAIPKLNIITFSIIGNEYNMYCSSFKEVDSSGMKYPVIWDLDMDGKADIFGSMGTGIPGQPYKHNLIIFGQDYVTKIIQPEEINIENEKIINSYPNPFNSITKIQFQVPSQKFVKLVVYDLLGREMKMLVNEYKQAGVYEVSFDASGLSSGVYYYVLFADGKKVGAKKMAVIK
ncbi:MAG: T9SS type A sorting domain-containing protein [Ignavibacteria bacterium]|nr:T9SS type A sorting domain-containing protein [Ignavibacteria bacterium]